MNSIRIQQIKPSATIEMEGTVAALKEAGVDVISLNAGEPDFDTPENICRACTKAMQEGQTKYVTVSGILPLKKAICAKLLRDNHVSYEPSEIVVSTGAKQALYNAIACICNPGDEVIIPTPCWVSYEEIVHLVDAKVVLVPTHVGDFQLDLDAIRAAITPKTKAIIINSPNNPTGVVYSAETLTRMAELLTEKSRAYGHTIYLVSDEPYRDIAFDGRPVPYPAAFYPHTLTCFSFSKSLSLPGERLGYVAVRPGCEGEDLLVDMMAQISRFTGHNCPPSIIQRAVSRCLNVTSDLSVYETNMNLLYDKLKALGFEVERPGGTFYIFPKALEEDANAFCLRARDYDLLLVPSDSFGVKGYVRLAYCIDTEKVERSLPALEKLAASYRK